MLIFWCEVVDIQFIVDKSLMQITSLLHASIMVVLMWSRGVQNRPDDPKFTRLHNWTRFDPISNQPETPNPMTQMKTSNVKCEPSYRSLFRFYSWTVERIALCKLNFDIPNRLGEITRQVETLYWTLCCCVDSATITCFCFYCLRVKTAYAFLEDELIA